jgi:hypothetical protein
MSSLKLPKYLYFKIVPILICWWIWQCTTSPTPPITADDSSVGAARQLTAAQVPNGAEWPDWQRAQRFLQAGNYDSTLATVRPMLVSLRASGRNNLLSAGLTSLA